MLDFTAEECARIVGCVRTGEKPQRITCVTTDSRSATPGALFVALQGPASDGHEFVSVALASGASAAVVRQGWNARDGVPESRLLRVESPLAALAALAAAHRARFNLPIVGVTGSSGKTTTKEMTGAALAPLGPILRTPESQNNEHGVPLAILRLEPEHRAAVIEMGMRGPGQIAELCAIACPTIGAITNIGLAHVGLLGSIQAIAAAKGELLAALPPDGTAVLLDQDATHPDYGVDLMSRLGGRRRLLFGQTERADYRVRDCCILPSETTAMIDTPEGTVRLTIRSPGQHQALNAACALAAAAAAGVHAAAAAAALDGFEPAGHRGRQLSLPGGATVIDESYNANPASMDAALSALQRLPGRKLVALGDMLELGDFSPVEHRRLGARAAEAGVDCLAAVGEHAEDVVAGAREHGLTNARAFGSPSEAADFLRERLHSGDLLMVKGSRGVKMERVVEALSNG